MAKYLAFMRYDDEDGEGQVATFEFPSGDLNEIKNWVMDRWKSCLLGEDCSTDGIVIYEISAKHELDLEVLREKILAEETLHREEELRAKELAELKRLQEKYHKESK